MSKDGLENECEKCGKDCEELVGKGLFLGNKDDRMFCFECYEEIHGEKWEE